MAISLTAKAPVDDIAFPVPRNGDESVLVSYKLPVMLGRPASTVLPAGWVVVSPFNYTERRHYEDY